MIMSGIRSNGRCATIHRTRRNPSLFVVILSVVLILLQLCTLLHANETGSTNNCSTEDLEHFKCKDDDKKNAGDVTNTNIVDEDDESLESEDDESLESEDDESLEFEDDESLGSQYNIISYYEDDEYLEWEREERVKQNLTVNYQKVFLEYFECNKVYTSAHKRMNSERKILRETYEMLYEKDYNGIPQFVPSEGDKIRVENYSYNVEMVFASEPILEGELVYTETIKTCRFNDVNDFFGEIIYIEHEVATCRILNESWVETLPAELDEVESEIDKCASDISESETIDKKEIVVRLAGEIYFAASMVDDNVEPNVICNAESIADNIKCHAVRDIKEGEDIIFSVPTIASSQNDKWDEMDFYRNFSLPELEYANPIVSMTEWVHDKGITNTVVRNLYGCDSVLSEERPMYDEKTWIELRRHYHGYPDDFDSPILHTNAFMIPYEVRQIAEKGRGIYATEKIKKGDLVYTGTPHAAKFRSRLDWLLFLATTRQDMVCDILIWAFCQDFNDYYGSEKDSDFTIVFALDDGNFANNEDGDTDANCGCHPLYTDKSFKICQENFFALRDIEPGEELIVAYGDFSDNSLWVDEFNL